MHFFLTEVPWLGKPIESNSNQIKILSIEYNAQDCQYTEKNSNQILEVIFFFCSKMKNGYFTIWNAKGHGASEMNHH